MKKNIKFWILFGLTILLSLGSQLLGQANRILTIAPTAQASSIGNVMLPMMNPARNLFNKDHFSFIRVNWMTNIVGDMSYNFVNLDRGPFGVNIMFFNYGDQLLTDEYGIVQGDFTPLSAVYGFNYARTINYDTSAFHLGFDTKNFVLSSYMNASFTILRNDSLDRFGTHLEKRYNKKEY